MRRLVQTNLFLSSAALLILVACSPLSGYKLVGTSTVDSSRVRPVIDRNNSLLYKAKIDLYNKHYSGLVVLKQTDQYTSHLIFVTEIGLKMFDFEIRDGFLKPQYVFEPLNKPKIVRLLESDLRLILLQDLVNREVLLYRKKKYLVYRTKNNPRHFYKINPDTKTVEQIIVKGIAFTRKKVRYLYDGYFIAEQIHLKHTGLIRLKIEFIKLDRNQY
jgi:hypothetical protein